MLITKLKDENVEPIMNNGELKSAHSILIEPCHL
jgi:hypothetical protein